MRENRTPGSARGLVGNGESYLNAEKKLMSYAIGLTSALLLIVSSGCDHGTDRKEWSEPVLPQETAETADLTEAISLSLAELETRSEKPSDYILIKAEQILVNNKFIWRITFKPKELLPADPSSEVIGVGGEIFVNVDPDTKETTLRHGE